MKINLTTISFIFIFLTISIVSFSQTIVYSVKNYIMQDYKTVQYNIVGDSAFVANYKIYTLFIPKEEEIFTVDSILKDYLKDQSLLLNDKNLNINGYVIQLMFVVDNNCKKLVFISSVSKGIEELHPDEIKTDFISVTDDGMNTFLAELDLLTKKFIFVPSGTGEGG
jgi:hypothetical protein